MVMPAETLATTKVKIAKIYALVRRNNDIQGAGMAQWLAC